MVIMNFYTQRLQFTIIPTMGIVWAGSYKFGISFMWLKWGFIIKFKKKEDEA